MFPEPWASLGLLGIYVVNLTCDMLQMELLTCTTMLAQRPESDAFEFGRGSFRELYFCSDGSCDVLYKPVVAEVDVQCRETHGRAL